MPDDRSRKVGTPVAARNEVSDRMGRLLKAQTEGEVLFDPASCGRYATDASIYQIIPVGVFVPKRAEDIAVAL
ncbi:MAG: hypothetical protein ABSF50_20500, partial [Burkholderiaceae bacterium]